MNSIVGFSELALDDEIPVKTKEYLAKILENAEGLLQIINDVLDISKVESGKMELERIPFDICELFNSCRSLILPKAEEKSIALHFYAEPSIGKLLLGDPTRLRQVFVNLLSNAVKFTNSGIVKLDVEIIEKSEQTIKMHFEVKDSGIGMTPEQVKKIFDPFTQAETGTTRKYGGTGLGLTITKNIIELMGGELLVESTHGVGSKFSFELTFDTIDVPNDEVSGQKLIYNEIEKPVFKGEVLLCEDNVMNQQVICEHLARVGLKTVVAENGKIGVEMVKGRKEKNEKQFDLIFMDMHMPVMDGLEASAKILELKTGVPIVAMTANIMSDDREKYKTNGMNDCIGKPFTSQELWRCLMKYLTPLSMGNVNANMSAQKSGLIKADSQLGNDGHLENDLKFQKNLMLMFAKGNRNKYEEIVSALKEGDIKLAHRLAHGLKSNAGQLGKPTLQKAAAEVENHLKDGKNETTQNQLALLKKELDAVLEQIAAQTVFQQDMQQAGENSPLDSQSAIELLEELEPMLIAGNSECLNLVDSLYRIPGSEKMIELIDDFDFEQAAAVLAELKEGLKQS
jgi:CheY-like chemotaxis protein